MTFTAVRETSGAFASPRRGGCGGWDLGCSHLALKLRALLDLPYPLG